MTDCPVPWNQPLRATSDSRIVDSISPALITRLDRPPKAEFSPLG
jgi:hypothetical protein